jgi:integrase
VETLFTIAWNTHTGTIRKRKGALSRVLEWLIKRYPLCLSVNPLSRLPHGYSRYTASDKAALAAEGADIPADFERDRRISRTEEARIVAHLEACRDGAKTAKDRSEYEALRVMFQLALRTAMRMREIYTLTRDQVRLDQKTVFCRTPK